MFIELSVKIGTGDYTAFFKGGFYNHTLTVPHLHMHNYTEIHLITGGNAQYTINDKTHLVKDGQMLVIPRNIFHCCAQKEQGTMICSFQLNCHVQKLSLHKIPSVIIDEFIREIKICGQDGDYTKLSSYISLFCSHFVQAQKLSAKKITDYAFLIYEFFSANYALDLHLCDLAKILHLSERQTERLVIEHTGKTFKEALCSIRMDMAKKLIQSSDMSMQQVARYVGYKSYAGFWKAMRKMEN